ncbi:MAG: CZB domain-containing protein [Candidatus Thiodiazotropha sp. (ex Gloverina cf. vestifex)]|nr:CZB domain-containing protein [Candidatus Thiodiazotropha sp. (ex Gloverina cf. vestifex)]
MSESAFFLRRMNDHVQYLGKIKTTLADKGDFQGTDHHTCKLEQWLGTEGPAQADAIGNEARAIFDSLIEPHEEFHSASHLALKRKADGDTEGMEQAMTKMFKLSVDLVDLLMDLDTMSQGR